VTRCCCGFRVYGIYKRRLLFQVLLGKGRKKMEITQYPCPNIRSMLQSLSIVYSVRDREGRVTILDGSDDAGSVLRGSFPLHNIFDTRFLDDTTLWPFGDLSIMICGSYWLLGLKDNSRISQSF